MKEILINPDYWLAGIWVLFGLITIIWWACSLTNRVGGLERVVQQLEVTAQKLEVTTQRLEVTTQGLQQSIQELQRSMQQLTGITQELICDVKLMNSRLSWGMSAGTSPLRLSELGKKVSEELHVKDWAARKVPSLFHIVREFEEFEIDQYCSEYVDKAFRSDQDLEKTIRRAAYKHSSPHFGITAILGIELRDCLIELQKQNRTKFRVVDALAC